jgi:quaternary ammonium compound-resistance protein SugE
MGPYRESENRPIAFVGKQRLNFLRFEASFLLFIALSMRMLMPAAERALRPENSFSTRRGDRMNWVILVIAGLCEVGWAIGLKYTAGFTRLWPTVWTVVSMIVSLWLLGIAMKGLPVGTAYGVWVGVGCIGTVILGILLFGEPATAGRLISVALIIAGIVGLKLATN